MNKKERVKYQVLEKKCYDRKCFVPLKFKVLKFCRLLYEGTCPEVRPLPPKKGE